MKYDDKARYYGEGGIETFDFLKAKLTEEELLGFVKANVIKYLTRDKGDDLRDIEKAYNYLKFYLENKN